VRIKVAKNYLNIIRKTQYVDIDEWSSGVKIRCLN
jgi:hypothetical protein